MSPKATSSESVDQVNRRSLPKSRTGCTVCKLRKVKCDEERPCCRNCRKRGATCTFGPSALRMNVCGESALTPLTPLSIHQPSPCLPLDDFGASGFTVSDMQLLHHYTTSTCLTFSSEPVVRDLWRFDVPQVGFSSNYVLRGALSLAALHLAHFRPKQRESYLIQAAAHYNAAAALALPLYSSVDSDNVIPLYLFSILTTYYASARPRQSEEFLFSSSGVIPDWLFLCRGVRPVVESEAFDLDSSPIAIMFQLGAEMHAIWETNTLESEPLLMLESSIRAHVEHSNRLNVLLEAVDSLKRSFAIVTVTQYTEEMQSMCIFAWLYKMREEYLDLIKDQDPEALCVLGFFCVLLHRLDRHWWIQGQSSHLMDRIYSLLDHKHRAWLRWPTEEMGWVPTC